MHNLSATEPVTFLCCIANVSGREQLHLTKNA